MTATVERNKADVSMIQWQNPSEGWVKINYM